MMKTKLFLLFCLLAFMAGSTLYAQHSAQAVFSIEGTYDASGFLELVKEKTGCRIAYKESDLKNSRRVLLDYQKKPLDVILKDASEKYGLLFVKHGNQLIVKKRKLLLSVSKEQSAPVAKDTVRSFYMQEVVKTAPRIDKPRNPQMGMTVMDDNAIRNVPTLLGEPDVIKALQLQPGVSAGTEGFAGMFVRGGENDENLFLIDGCSIYHTNHLGGLFSPFNANAVSHLTFYKSAFPARYGGRLSSVTDLSMKSGDYESWHGNFTMGLTSANVSFSGPLVKDQTSLFVALRRSWLELVSVPALAIINASKKKSGEKVIAGYNFTDFNLKLSHRLRRFGTLSLLGYYGHDRLKMGEHRFSNDGEDTDPYFHKNENRLGWGNMLTSLRWHLPINTLFAYNMKASYTRYQSDFRKTVETVSGREGKNGYENNGSRTESRNAIHDLSVDASLAFIPSDRTIIRLGTQYTHHRYTPEEEIQESTSLPSGNGNNESRVIANEWNAYLEGDLEVFHWLRFNAGMHGSFFRVEGKQYQVFEPRVSADFRLSPVVSLKAGYARMSQFVQQVSDNYISLPTDYWLPITRNFSPLTSDQFSAGIYVSPDKKYTFSVEGYYKKMDHLLEYRDDYKDLQVTSWEDRLTSGSGRAYGADFQAEADFGKLHGFIGYGLMWSDRLFADQNGGKRFPSKYDNRHKVTLSATWKCSERVELNAGWVFMTGNRVTLSLENYSYPDGYPTNIVPSYPHKDEEMLDYYAGKNNVRLPAYHRLDVGINIYRSLRRGRTGIWNVSLYNAYSRMNPIMIEKNNQKQSMDGTPLAPRFRQFALFPIIPSVSYTYKF
ncbi:MAG: TonB-dependent receptor plug domain-containing protein [Phocaeicola plebeius]|uniref:TonB-dependent receptor plug domain-containing protein n=2 Tax=Phocaeicola plebeius TaxID=310297 RepID=UPI00241BE74E|nr:TonB-dependent receptor plug domain-containing protein [Phocaeicola plebeius]MBS5538958.1 TonB-dependent receptor plug domain-containing protein [Phocaeicola plebeius]